jgi:hypothetical protein
MEKVEAEKSTEKEEGSFFDSVPRATQRGRQAGRPVFGDITSKPVYGNSPAETPRENPETTKGYGLTSITR